MYLQSRSKYNNIDVDIDASRHSDHDDTIDHDHDHDHYQHDDCNNDDTCSDYDPDDNAAGNIDDT